MRVKIHSHRHSKLILLSGQLHEFALLPQDSDCFICSSDEMEFGEFPAAMGGDEAEDMAALALKASLALATNDDDRIIRYCCCCWSKLAQPAALFCEKEMPLLGGDGGGAGQRKFVAKLSAIVED
ncbi:hypothetical protein SASPL_104524 [Salvia splendens]|uniref:Uncharacterized protein n=1 Tax=Salvia splendens TaxID=180675 RepID=A0A8X9A7S7_SALSN|nr:uncharacterized protein LOC121773567 [Salvia splendens]KAG6432932.1 hypothetical protein SASPL_104524 [Salvia splendens]